MYTSDSSRECSHAVLIPAQCLVRRRLGCRSQARAVSPHDLRQACRDVPPVQRPGLRAGGRLLAPAGAAVQGAARWRHGRLRLSRTEIQCAGPLHLHALAGNHQPVGLRALLSRGRAASFHLAVDGRSGAGRSRAGAGHALERRSGLGRRRQDHSCEVRLSPRGRQPDGPHPRDLRARLQHRQRPRRRSPVRRHPWRQDRDRDALDARHRGAAVLGRAVAASPARSTAGRSSTSRRPAPSTSTSAWRLPAPARRKATARRASTVLCSTP